LWIIGAFIAGLFVGANFGAVLMGWLVANKRLDKD